MSDIKKIKDDFLLKLKENLDLNQVNQIKTDLFGKNGLLSSQFKKLGGVAENERKKIASNLNAIKDELQNLIVKKIQDIETKEINKKLEKEKGIKEKKQALMDDLRKQILDLDPDAKPVTDGTDELDQDKDILILFLHLHFHHLAQMA